MAFRNALDELSQMPGPVGDAVRSTRTNPPKTGETSDQYDTRTSNEEYDAQTRQNQEANAITATARGAETAQRQASTELKQGLTSQGKAFWTDTGGQTRPITTAAGTNYNRYDDSGVIWNPETGEPSRTAFDSLNQPPSLVDPYAGAPIKTVGTSRMISPVGVPWKYAGEDEAAAADEAQKEQDKADRSARAAASREQIVEKRGVTYYDHKLRENDKQLAAQGIPPDLADNSPLDQLVQPPEVQKGMFGFGSETPESVQARKDAAARSDTVKSIIAQRQDLQGKRDAHAQRYQDSIDAGIMGVNDAIPNAEADPTTQDQNTQGLPQEGQAPTSTIPGIDGKSSLPQGQPTQALADAQAGKKAYGYDPEKGVQFHPGKLAEGISQASQDGLIAADKAQSLTEQAAKADQAHAAQQEVIKSAGNNSELKAILSGAIKGSAFAAGAPAGAGVGATIGALGGPLDWLTVPAGAIIGGLISGTITSFAAKKAMEALGNYNDSVKSLVSSSELHPNYDAAGNILSFGVGIPKAAMTAAGEVIGRLGETGVQVAGQKAGAGFGANVINSISRTYGAGGGGLWTTVENLARDAAIRKAGGASQAVIASAITARVGGAALANVAIDTVINEGAKALGLQQQGETLPSAVQAGLIGAFLSGHGINFKGYDTGEVADILSRAQDAMKQGADLKTVLDPREFEVFGKFQEEITKLRAEGKVENIDPDKVRVTAEQALQGNSPYGVTSVKIESGEAGASPEGNGGLPAPVPSTPPNERLNQIDSRLGEIETQYGPREQHDDQGNVIESRGITDEERQLLDERNNLTSKTSGTVQGGTNAGSAQTANPVEPESAPTATAQTGGTVEPPKIKIEKGDTVTQDGQRYTIAKISGGNVTFHPEAQPDKPVESPVNAMLAQLHSGGMTIEKPPQQEERIVAAALKDPISGKIFTGATHGFANPRDRAQLDLDKAKEPQNHIGYVTNTGRWLSQDEAADKWGIKGSETSAAYWSDAATKDAALGRGNKDDQYVNPITEDEYNSELGKRVAAEREHYRKQQSPPVPAETNTDASVGNPVETKTAGEPIPDTPTAVPSEAGTSNLTAPVEKNVNDLLMLNNGDHAKAAAMAGTYAENLHKSGNHEAAVNFEAAKAEIEKRAQDTEPKETPEGKALLKLRSKTPHDSTVPRENLIHGALSFSGGTERIAKLVREGATDEQVKKMLGSEFGIQGGTGKHMVFGGENPRLEISSPDQKSVIKGKPLITLAREAFNIPEPKTHETKPTPESKPTEDQSPQAAGGKGLPEKSAPSGQPEQPKPADAGTPNTARDTALHALKQAKAKLAPASERLRVEHKEGETKSESGIGTIYKINDGQLDIAVVTDSKKFPAAYGKVLARGRKFADSWAHTAVDEEINRHYPSILLYGHDFENEYQKVWDAMGEKAQKVASIIYPNLSPAHTAAEWERMIFQVRDGLMPTEWHFIENFDQVMPYLKAEQPDIIENHIASMSTLVVEPGAGAAPKAEAAQMPATQQPKGETQPRAPPIEAPEQKPESSASPKLTPAQQALKDAAGDLFAQNPKLRLADDMPRQVQWLEQQAQQRGFHDITELAKKKPETFTKLAVGWRKSHPAEELAAQNPILTNARRTGTEIRLSFDANGKFPTADELREKFKERGHDVEVTKFATNLITATQGKVNYRIDVYNATGQMSSKSAEAAMASMFGSDQPFSSKSDFERGASLDARFAAMFRYGNGENPKKELSAQSPAIYSADIPPEKLAAFIPAIAALVKESETPEKFAASLKGISDKATAYTQSMWFFAKGVGAKGEDRPDWSKIYAALAAPLSSPETQPDAPTPATTALASGEENLTFDQFEKQYRAAFTGLMKYKPDEVGSQHYAEKMAALSDAHPEWAETVENSLAKPTETPETPSEVENETLSERDRTSKTGDVENVGGAGKPADVLDSGRLGGEQSTGVETTGEERGVTSKSEGSRKSGSGSATEGHGSRRTDAAVESVGDGGDIRRDSENAGVEPNNYIITPADDIGGGSLSDKFANNIAAIKALKTIEAGDGKATDTEKKALVKYVGWGGMKNAFNPDKADWQKKHAELKELLTPKEYEAAQRSILDSHYTSPDVIGGIYQALGQFGFRGGKMVEGGSGIGHFIGLLPVGMRDGTSYIGVEKDSITARIAQVLYPDARIIHGGFEKADLQRNSFDASAGNPPFGQQQLFDPDFKDASRFSIHNFFIAKQIELLRPGGIGAWVVSHYFLDAQDGAARKWINDRADFLGAIRLPNTAFKKNAGTEVTTDIVFFQKRTLGQKALDSVWVNVGDETFESPEGDQAGKLNEWFKANPDMMLGVPSLAGTMHAGKLEFTLNPNSDKPLKEQIEKAVNKLPRDVYQQALATETERIARRPEADIPDVKIGSYFVDKAGNIQRRAQDINTERTSITPEFQNSLQGERVRGMVGVRDALNQLIKAETTDADPKIMKALRGKLNKFYNAFVEKHGPLNTFTNRRAFQLDTDATRVLALERNFDPGIGRESAKKKGVAFKKPSADKAAIFKQRVNVGYTEVTHATGAKDALTVSLNQRGTVDLPYMSKLSGIKQADIITELGEQIFQDPTGDWQQAEQYLSGNVRDKLRVAEAAAQDNASFERNVEALKKVIPADIPPQDIRIPLGAGWVDPKYYGDFALEHAKENPSMMAYAPAVAKWNVSMPDATTEARDTYGTSRAPFGTLLSALMNTKPVQVFDRHHDGSQTLNKEETAAAQQKAELIKEKWNDWVMSEEARRTALSRTYNDTINNYADTKPNGLHLTLPGKSALVNLYPHQLNGAWRIMTDRTALLDQVVGAGKTFIVSTTVMEMKRLGFARKQMIVVPNHLTTQWRDSIIQLYPNANVLYATAKDFAKKNRQTLFAKMMTGEYDAIIIGHSSLIKVGMPKDAEVGLLKEMLNELVDTIRQMRGAEANARGKGRDSRFMSGMERTKEALEAKLARAIDRTGKKDSGVTFDELGIDGLYIDEAHEFKNLFYTTSMQRVAGLGNPEGSAKAFDLYVKTRWMRQRYGGKAPLVFATGTPVSNSLVEMFTMQRYLQGDKLKAMGLNTLDAWARVFGDVRSVYEVDPSGTGYRLSTRFANFQNVGELSAMYRSVADVVTLDDLKQQAIDRGKVFPVPKIKGGKPNNIVVDRSKEQGDYFGHEIPRLNADGSEIVDNDGNPMVDYTSGSLLDRITNMDPSTPELDNMLKVTNDARKSSLDMRLINPHLPDFEGSKPNRAVKEIKRIYDEWNSRKGTQLVFCDLSVPSSARGKATTKAKELAAETYIRSGSHGYEIVPGAKPVHLQAAPELSFFISKAVSGKGYSVTEMSTGRRIAGGETMAEATENAERSDALHPGNRDALLAQMAENAIPLEEITKLRNEYEIRHGFKKVEETIDDSDELAEDKPSEGVSMDELLADSSKHSVYDDMRDKLIASGVPAKQIAFIHDYDTPEKKQKLFDAMNNGDVRILFGSTPKLGVGTNVQRRLVAITHLDAPWRPSDLEQREGRIIRQGNYFYEQDPEGFEVEISRLATKQTYDTRMWQLIEHKAAGIGQFRKADRTTRDLEDVSGEAANASDMKAAASGDPAIQREIELRGAVKKLTLLQRAWQSSHYQHESNVKWLKGAPDRYKSQRVEWDNLNAFTAKNPKPEEFTSKVKNAGGQLVDVTERKAFADAFIDAVKSMSESNDRRGKLFGEYRGLTLTAIKVWGNVSIMGTARNVDAELTTFYSDDRVTESGLVQRLDNTLDNKANARIAVLEEELERAKQRLPEEEKIAARPFDKQDELDAAREKHAKALTELRSNRRKRTEAPPEAGQSGELDAANPITSFYSEDVEPRVRGLTDALSQVSRHIKMAVNPMSLAEGEGRQVGHALKEGQAGIQRSSDIAWKALEGVSRAVDGIKDEELADTVGVPTHIGTDKLTPRQRFGIAFEHAIERPDEVKLPKVWNDFRTRIREVLDLKRDEALDEGALHSIVENYFPHIWDLRDQEKAKQFLATYFGKRPMRGSGAFRKKRSIPTVLDGVKAGLRPVTFNPVEAVVLKNREISKWIMAARFKKEFGADGRRILKFNKASEKMPDDHAKLDDAMFTVWGPRMVEATAKNSKFYDEDGKEIDPADIEGDIPPEGATMKVKLPGKLLMGYYSAPSELAHIVNTFTSSGLRQRSQLFAHYLGVANVMNQFQLGLSFFHGGFVVTESMVSELARAMEQLAGGHPISALKTAADVPFAPVFNYLLGTKMQREWSAPGSQGREITQLLNAAIAGGARGRQDEFYATQLTKAMREAFRNGNVLGGILRVPFAIVEQAARPIMEVLVPRIKLAVFAKMVQDAMKENPAMTHDELREAASSAWNSADDRMGQVVYDNLFLNKTLKDLLLGSIRSLGWNFGTFRQIGGGLYGLMKESSIGLRMMIGGRGGRPPTPPGGEPPKPHGWGNWEQPDGKGGVRIIKGRKPEFTHQMAYVLALPLFIGLAGALLMKLTTGKNPDELKDYYFPKVGGDDANGNPQRVSLPSYMKDIFAYSKHPLTTLSHKLHPMLAMIGDMLRNSDYYGVQIRNEDDNIIRQALDEIKYAGKTMAPFSLRGIEQLNKAGASPGKMILPMFGIVPAPASIDKSPAMNLASDINKGRMPSEPITEQQAERRVAKSDLVRQIRRNDFSHVANEIRTGRIKMQDLPRIERMALSTPLQNAVRGMTLEQAMRVYTKATPQERIQIQPIINTKRANAVKSGTFESLLVPSRQ